ncbi:MAG: hypothetical protein ACE5GX_09465 [Thermoanaerobaculia bacterium]
MRPRFDFERRVLTLVFPDGGVARDYLAEVRATGGLLATAGRRLAQYDVFEVRVELPAAGHEAFRAYVARVTEDESGAFATAFVLQDWDEASERELFEKLDGSSNPVDEDDASEPEESDGEMRGVAAVHAIREMNMGQKTILAQRAGRAERQVLLRDNAPQVLQGLLANPRVEAKEILRIAKSTYATGAILQRIAGDSRWGKNQEIIAAIVRNPKSPTLMVTRMVDKLRTSDLRQMSKMSSGLKETLRKAALREYMKRTGQR